MKQEIIVYNVLKELGGRARTEEIKRKCLNAFNGVSCPDRYLRFMVVKGREIVENIGKVKDEDSTDTWIIKKPYTPAPNVKEKPKPPPEKYRDLFDISRFGNTD